MRDTQALNKYLIMVRSRSNDLLAQATKLMAMDINTNAQRLSFADALISAEASCKSVQSFLQKSADEFIAIGGPK